MMLIYLASIAQVSRALLGPLLPDTERPSCICKDKDLEILRDLIRQGIPQLRASQMIWAPELARQPQRSPADDASSATWRAWGRMEIRRLANDARRVLGLRLIPETAEETP